MKLPTFAHTVFLAALFSILALSLTGCEAEADPTPDAGVSLTANPGDSTIQLLRNPLRTPTVTPTLTPSPTLDTHGLTPSPTVHTHADADTHTDAIADT